MWISRVILVFILCTGSKGVFSQPAALPEKNIVFSRLPENLGLSQSSINDVLQDRDGYLWVATWSGLIRYDGYSTRVFHSGNGATDLKGNLISCLFEDHEGTIWVGTHVTGLFRYDKKNNHFVNYAFDPGQPNSISNNNIWKITEDADHNLWIGTENGLNFLDRNTQKFTTFKNDPRNANSLSDNFVTDIFIAGDKSLWVATNYGLNNVVTSGSGINVQRFFDPRAENAHNFVYKVMEIPNGRQNEIWFITKKGVKRLLDGVITNYGVDDKGPNYSLFRSMYPIQGKKTTLLLGSAMGLSFFDVTTRKFEKHISNLDGFSFDQGQSMAVTATYIDRGGVLWVGTKKGLYKSDSYRKDFDLFLTSSFDVTNSIITGIRRAEKGYWISTIGGGIFHFDGTRFVPAEVNTNEKNDFAPFVQSLFTDRSGNIWAGTAGAGVIVYTPQGQRLKTLHHFHTASIPAISDDYIVSFAEDREGSVWVGTWNGNLIEINRSWEVINYDSKPFGGLPLVTLYADNAGAIWAGSKGAGVFHVRKRNSKLDVRHFVNAPDSGSIVNNFVNAIYEDHAGSLWLATEGGLVLFDRRTEKFRTIPIVSGPTNKVIVGVLEDDEHRLWLSHWNGITVINPAHTAQDAVRNFDTHDYIQGGFFYNNVCLKDEEKLLFGGSNGLNVIRPGNLAVNPIKPNVIITDFRLFNQPVIPGVNINGRALLTEPLDVTREIRLRYHESTISFEFAALDFAAPEKIRYAYKLEGFDKDWNNTPSTRRYANYTNLGEGSYEFKVRSTNNDGLWNSSVARITVIVLPPWWKTEWAYVSYVLVTALLLYFFRKLILIRANFIHDLKLERLERENLEKLNRAKLQFFTNISHEFRTPLTLILGPVQSLMDAEGSSKFFREQLHMINNNAQRLLRLVNQLLDFRKAETGNLALKVSEGNLVRFVKEIKLSFEGLAEQMRIEFSLIASSNIISVYFDRDQFEKILFNLLSNAFKNTPEGGKIGIEVREQEDRVLITIKNSGRGIKPEHFDQIFQTFFSYEEDRHATGTGIGLALVKSLVDAHHGTIEVASVENEMTRFTITLLKGNDHFDQTELADERHDPESVGQYPPYLPTANVPEDSSNRESLEGLPKVLIVEDNSEVRAYIRSVFTDRYIVLEAEHGKEGLNLALEEIPDVIISDIMMPVMDGIRLCKELKSNIKTSHIPVILLTARTSLIFKVEGLETGADDYVNKPFNPTLLQLKVRNLLRTRAMMRKLFADNEMLQIEPRRVTLNSADELFIGKVLESIERNMSSPEYSVEVLGEDVAMSRMQLYRKLKSLTGQSGVEFIRTIRLKRAAQLLEQNRLTIAEITYEVGFNDLQYFRECFKKQFGVTPSEYIQRANEKQVAGGDQG